MQIAIVRQFKLQNTMVLDYNPKYRVSLRRQWHPTPVLAWKIPWTEEPGWLPSMGSLRVEHD